MVGGAEAGVGGAQALTGGGRVAFRGSKAVPIRCIRGVDLCEAGPRGNLTLGSDGDLRPQRIAFLGERPFTLPKQQHLPVGAGHPFFGHHRRGFRSSPAMLGLPPRRLPGARFFGQAVASGAQGCRSGVPGGDPGAILRTV